ncbi:MAG TPA: DNA-3-methyladenine glycosylase [Anaerolineaceae bacterium]|nr:DNA-3-methyladenine glycosylase [Anaerolineaceae bacterium]
MNDGEIIPFAFYQRPVIIVAQELLGKRLVRNLDGQVVSGIISETEAYDGMQDLACHARAGKTKRNAVMFGLAGHAYVYFTYGMHWCLNVVTGEIGYPAAVLIRAIEPIDGLRLIARNRPNIVPKNWTNGPAKLTQALQIDGSQNGIDLTSKLHNLWIENGWSLEEKLVKTGPRVGISNTPEPWRSLPWRFWIDPENVNHKGLIS